jgi:hypothetical protein
VPEKSNRLVFKKKPDEEWKQEHRITTDHPFDRFVDWLKSFSKAGREAKKLNDKLQEEFQHDRIKKKELNFDYAPGAGVEGRVGYEAGILAKGFGECSGLVFQVPDRVAVVHISPNIFRDTFEGGELVRDCDFLGHIRFALKELLIENENKFAKKTKRDTSLTKEEVAEIQKMIDSGTLKATMLSGEDEYVPDQIVRVLGNLAGSHGLPSIKTDIHYVGAMGGGGGYAIYASPEEMYFIGANGEIMKKGVNFPPTMYECKEEKEQ